MGNIQFRRRITGPIAPVPTPAVEGMPYFSAPGFVGGGPNALWLDTGATMVPLVDRTRQVELAGAQTITGVKTISGTGAIAFDGVANMSFADGAPGQVMTKGAGNGVTWADVTGGATGVTSFNTRTGAVTLTAADVTGVAGLLSTGGTMTGALALAADAAAAMEAVPLQQLTAAIAAIPAPDLSLYLPLAGGAMDAAALITAAAVPTAGGHLTNKAYVDGAITAIPPVDLSPYLLLAGGVMTPTATITAAAVPTVNGHLTNKLYVDTADGVLQQQVDLLASNLLFAGTILVVTDVGDYSVASGMTDGPLPLPTAALTNYYVIVTDSGVSLAGNIPAATYAAGDWIVCDGAAWVRMPIGQPTGTVSEAPVDTFAYGRLDAAWQRVLPLTGGEVTGVTTFSAPGEAIDVTASLRVHAALQMGDAASAGMIWIDGPVSSPRQFRWQTAGSARWQLGMTGTPEGGADVGADMVLQRYDDAGVVIGQVLNISRSTGSVGVLSGLGLGSSEAASTIDFSKHLALYGTTHGISVTAGRVNYVGSVAQVFCAGSVDIVSITGTGLEMFAGTVTLFRDAAAPLEAVTLQQLEAFMALKGVTKTDRSGVITAGGTAQSLMTANPDRIGWSFQNKSNSDIYYNDLGGAADPASASSVYLPPGAYYESEPGGASIAAISIYGGVTDAVFVAKEW